ncbi:MAG: FAD/NAD(P)-binding oxidoreductase [Haloarculaceae archaeon]
MGERFLVVGGDAAGLSAASKARRDAPDVDVTVFERSNWASFGACGLPYYVQGEIATLDELTVMEPRRLVEERGIDLRRRHEVVDVDRAARTVTVESETGRYEEAYDHLLLATGAHAPVPDVPGADLDGVFSVRSPEAGRALKNYVAHHEARPVRGVARDRDRVRSGLDRGDVETVGIVGANKIGVELAEAFLGRGLDVHVFESGTRVLPSFGRDVAEMVEDHLREAGVDLHLRRSVERFHGRDGRVTDVETSDGAVAVDAVVADVGVEPNVDLAVGAGIELGETGAIATDEYGRTNDPVVYAAGDCAEKRPASPGRRSTGPTGWRPTARGGPSDGPSRADPRPSASSSGRS